MVDGLGGKTLKIAFRPGRFPVIDRVGVDDGVVLIGFEGLFPPAFTAHQQPAVFQGRWTEFFVEQIKDPVEDLVIEDGNHPGDIAGFGPLVENAADDIGNLLTQRVDAEKIVLGGNLLEQVVGRISLLDHDVMGGDHPFNPPPIFHAKMVDTGTHHLQQDIKAKGL